MFSVSTVSSTNVPSSDSFHGSHDGTSSVTDRVFLTHQDLICLHRSKRLLSHREHIVVDFLLHVLLLEFSAQCQLCSTLLALVFELSLEPLDLIGRLHRGLQELANLN